MKTLLLVFLLAAPRPTVTPTPKPAPACTPTPERVFINQRGDRESEGHRRAITALYRTKPAEERHPPTPTAKHR